MDLAYDFSQEPIKIVDDEQGATTLKWIQVKENAVGPEESRCLSADMFPGNFGVLPPRVTWPVDRRH